MGKDVCPCEFYYYGECSKNTLHCYLFVWLNWMFSNMFHGINPTIIADCIAFLEHPRSPSTKPLSMTSQAVSLLLLSMIVRGISAWYGIFAKDFTGHPHLGIPIASQLFTRIAVAEVANLPMSLTPTARAFLKPFAGYSRCYLFRFRC